MKAKIVTVRSDKQGLIPDSLRETLEDYRKSKFDAPKILYIQPNHNNPTAVTLPVDRRREIYKIAQEFDLLIIEDDPYFLLTFNEPFPPSILSMDVDGRVIRLDSFSKVMAAGMRIGFVSGAWPFIERLIFHMYVGPMECPSFSQAIVFELLQRWGVENFLKHSRTVARFYQSQCEKLLNAADKHLTGLAEWTKPQGGMFIWMRALGVDDTSAMITEKALQKQIVLAPGNFFMFDSDKPTPYMRASYSNVDESKMDEGFRRLADLIRSEQNKK